MKILKTMFYFMFCGLYPFVKKEYFKGLFLMGAFFSSLYLLYAGIHAEGFSIIILIFLSTFLFFFSIIYNFLDVCVDRKIPLKKSYIKKDDKNSYRQAVEFYLKGETEKAIQIFSSMRKDNKNDADLYFQLGKMYYKGKEYGKAKKMLKKYLLFDVGTKWKRETFLYLKDLEVVT